MSPDEIRDEIKKLDIAQKLTLVEDLWDEITASNEAIPLYDWQKKELDERLNEYNKGNVRKFDWQGVHERIRNKYE